jgi:serine protease Do
MQSSASRHIRRSIRFSGTASILVAAIAICSFAVPDEVRADGLDSKILPKVQAATFEVVSAKPVEDNLTYIKPLPLDLLPFQERNDKYFSIGTAFSIGDNRYVSAAHVLDACIGGLWGAPALRDANGNVYPIDKIEKFSLRRDFVVFSLTGNPKAPSLQTNPKPEINTTVYAVGNALGTGVVVRDGLYTSKTPEEQEGSWSWLRFSAAASPGNSGGPLLDKSGKVIGVVLRKSANENLNYALPIDEVIKAPDHRADIDVRVAYQLDNLDFVQNDTFKTDFPLPLSVAEFSATFQKLWDGYSDKQLAALLAKEPDKIFPRGKGSSRLLHHVARMQTFPALITRQSDGDWVLSEKSGKKTPLSGNGYVLPGIAGRNLLFHLHKPDDLSASELYTNPEQLINQLLKVGFLQRPVGTEKVEVVGMGKPTEDSLFTDSWQRRWQVRIWPVPFANAMFVTFSLPVPDGYVTMSKIVPARESHETVIDLRAMTDFLDVAYQGTLAQWKEFTNNDSLLPAALRTLKIDFQDGRRFSYGSPRVSFSFPNEVQTIGPANLLALGFVYINDSGNMSWDVGDIRVQRDANDHDWVNIERHVTPSEDLDDTFKSTWDKIVNRRHPFDAVVRNEEDDTKITAVASAPGGSAPMVLYSVFVGVAGNSSQSAMKSKLDLLMKNVHVGEH